jgi:hypothetical protein
MNRNCRPIPRLRRRYRPAWREERRRSWPVVMGSWASRSAWPPGWEQRWVEDWRRNSASGWLGPRSQAAWRSDRPSHPRSRIRPEPFRPPSLRTSARTSKTRARLRRNLRSAALSRSARPKCEPAGSAWLARHAAKRPPRSDPATAKTISDLGSRIGWERGVCGRRPLSPASAHHAVLDQMPPVQANWDLVRGGDGAPGGIRTPDHLIRSQMLCPLSYGRAGDEVYPTPFHARFGPSTISGADECPST